MSGLIVLGCIGFFGLIIGGDALLERRRRQQHQRKLEQWSIENERRR